MIKTHVCWTKSCNNQTARLHWDNLRSCSRRSHTSVHCPPLAQNKLSGETSHPDKWPISIDLVQRPTSVSGVQRVPPPQQNPLQLVVSGRRRRCLWLSNSPVKILLVQTQWHRSGQREAAAALQTRIINCSIIKTSSCCIFSMRVNAALLLWSLTLVYFHVQSYSKHNFVWHEKQTSNFRCGNTAKVQLVKYGLWGRVIVLKAHYHDSFKFLNSRIRGQLLRLIKGK